jgi:prevent-host-death family protein
MLKVGAFEAKTHLSALLEKVSRGEEVLITRRGKAVARLVPADADAVGRGRAAAAKLLALRKDARLEGLDWRELRDEGRR